MQTCSDTSVLCSSGSNTATPPALKLLRPEKQPLRRMISTNLCYPADEINICSNALWPIFPTSHPALSISIQRSGSLPREDAADTAGPDPSAPAAVGNKKLKPAPSTKPQKQKTEKQMLEQACPSVSCMASVVCQEWDVPWRNLFRVVGKIIKYLCMSTILLKSLRFSWGSFWDHFFLCGGFLSISPLQGQQHCESQLDRAHGAQNQVGKCWTRCSETWFLIR